MTIRGADLPPYVDTGAAVDEPYRYRLWRRWWPAAPQLTWIMLNPSTADADTDDATIAKCRRFAVAWRFGGMDVVNLFAFRATKPVALRTVSGESMAATEAAVIGPRNGDYLDDATVGAVAYTDPPMGRVIVAGWGAHGQLYDRGRVLLEWMAQTGRPVHRLVANADGTPRHPLYVPGVTRPHLIPTGP